MKMYLVFGNTSRSDGDNIEAICFDKELAEKKQKRLSEERNDIIYHIETMNTLDEPVKKNKEDR